MAHDAWWRDYFDEDFYELYRPFLPEERTQEEVAAVLELLALPAGSRVLDLACGWGRHAVPLAGAGLAVTGLDYSATLLAHARELAAEAGVAVEWVQRDLRELDWEGEFNAVLSLFSSLGYAGGGADADDLQVLRGVRRALRPGGAFLLETMHRDHIVRDFAPRDWWIGERGEHVWVHRELDAVAGVVREWLHWRGGGLAAGEKYHELRLRTATEWNVLLRAAGLVPREWYGSWELAPFDHESESLIVLATAA
jgi:SAM-dependent methyltransferase